MIANGGVKFSLSQLCAERTVVSPGLVGYSGTSSELTGVMSALGDDFAGDCRY
jgi:hypothetical protein